MLTDEQINSEVLSAVMLRVRHCVECPKCRIRYLPGFSPYRNGSYLVPLTENLPTEWTLYCSCCTPPCGSRSESGFHQCRTWDRRSGGTGAVPGIYREATDKARPWLITKNATERTTGSAALSKSGLPNPEVVPCSATSATQKPCRADSRSGTGGEGHRGCYESVPKMP
jgi:hypothetical protein